MLLRLPPKEEERLLKVDISDIAYFKASLAPRTAIALAKPEIQAFSPGCVTTGKDVIPECHRIDGAPRMIDLLQFLSRPDNWPLLYPEDVAIYNHLYTVASC